VVLLRACAAEEEARGAEEGMGCHARGRVCCPRAGVCYDTGRWPSNRTKGRW
jgi:hypothetical protein